MRYLFDIGHPAEFHYFSKVIEWLLKKGHEVLITARDKDVTLDLVKKSGLDYINTGKNLPSKIGKIFSLFRNDICILKAIKKFKPHLIVNFFSPFAAQAGWLCRKPIIGFHDTEIASVSIRLAQPFTTVVVVPECYTRQLPEKKTIRFRGYFELCHLHPRYFTPDPSVRDILGIENNEKYVLTRFISRHAIHDIGLNGMSMDIKKRAVREFSRLARVFVSSEEKLPHELELYRIDIPPEKMHDVLFFASLCYGESATMSAESAMLGTPAIYLDDRGRGYSHDLEKRYGLVFNFSLNPRAIEQSVQRGIELIQENDEQKWQARRQQLLGENIDVSRFMLWFIEQYPESVRIMKKDPEYQLKFK